MAKKTVHLDALGSFESFRAPWQTEAGADAEIDKPKLARLLYNVKADLAKARDSHEETREALAATEAERDEFKKQAADASGAEAQKELEKLRGKVADLTAERDSLKSAKELSDLRATVLAGVDPKVAKYVQGTTEEELTESLKAVKEDFGISDEPGEEEDGEEENENVGRTSPRITTRTVKNPADRTGGGADREIDINAEVERILGVGGI